VAPRESVPDILDNILPGVADATENLDDVSSADAEEIIEADPDAEGADSGDEQEIAGDSNETESEGDAAAAADDKRARGDGRTLPSALKDLIKAHPEHSKLLKDLYFTNAAYGKFGKTADIKKLKDAVDAFGSFEEFSAVKDRIEAIGGPAAIEELVQKSSRFDDIEQKFDSADPSYVEMLAKGNPEAFGKLAPAFINRFGTDHPEAYNHLMAQVVTNTLIQNGTFNNIAMLEAAVTAGNTQQAAEALKQIKASLSNVQALAQKAPEVKVASNPKLTEMETKLQQYEREKQQAFIGEIKNATNAWVTPEIGKALTSYLKDKKVTGAFKTSLDGAIKEEVGKILNNNAAFKAKRDAAFKRGDREGLLRIYKQFATPLIPQAARKVAREYGLQVPAKKTTTQTETRTETGKQTVEPGWEKVTKYPDPKDVRKDIPNYYDMAAEDKFILKSGKKIQVVS